MDETSFHELIKAGLGRGILYARDHDVRAFRDVILDACLHCYSADAQMEGTRVGYMFELLDQLPDRQYYLDEVLNALPGSGDDWDAVQRFRFATNMALDGDERAKRTAYESFNPGPKYGEAIAIDFLRIDGAMGFVFAASKIGGLLMRNADEVDQGWLWFEACEMFGEEEALATLLEAGLTDPRVEAYRRAVTAGEKGGSNSSKQVNALSYDELRQRMSGLWGGRLAYWGSKANVDDLERAATGLLKATTLEDQTQHIRIFSRRQFPLDPAILLKFFSSANRDLAYPAAVALSRVSHPAVRAEAFRLSENLLVGREWAIRMLDQNWEPGDHDIVLSWFERELDRDVRHHMQREILDFWEHHPDPGSEIRMLHSSYERGTCSFCREAVVKRFIELNALSDSLRAECAYDANEDIRALVATVP